MPKGAGTDIVTIRAEFASDIQRNAAMKSLRQNLTAWQRAAEENHRETKITITYGSENPETEFDSSR